MVDNAAHQKNNYPADTVAIGQLDNNLSMDSIIQPWNNFRQLGPVLLLQQMFNTSLGIRQWNGY